MDIVRKTEVGKMVQRMHVNGSDPFPLKGNAYLANFYHPMYAGGEK